MALEGFRFHFFFFPFPLRRPWGVETHHARCIDYPVLFPYLRPAAFSPLLKRSCLACISPRFGISLFRHEISLCIISWAALFGGNVWNGLTACMAAGAFIDEDNARKWQDGRWLHQWERRCILSLKARYLGTQVPRNPCAD
ncbi:hypothetical protein BS50DRAFT_300943 [Corynespora cassiicola Philippines]|uniref:Uncharacterized protein n=1 Tax=Corynespora cassiicola Philippines TaxID=1448308 RepID=A0A2T2NXE2_CORCC|nr:hypothetical protein BS50DRAFT_300943 [Corynespora cassiicola Philippines]